jgi:hypothetical protein
MMSQIWCVGDISPSRNAARYAQSYLKSFRRNQGAACKLVSA